MEECWRKFWAAVPAARLFHTLGRLVVQQSLFSFLGHVRKRYCYSIPEAGGEAWLVLYSLSSVSLFCLVGGGGRAGLNWIPVGSVLVVRGDDGDVVAEPKYCLNLVRDAFGKGWIVIEWKRRRRRQGEMVQIKQKSLMWWGWEDDGTRHLRLHFLRLLSSNSIMTFPLLGPVYLLGRNVDSFVISSFPYFYFSALCSLCWGRKRRRKDGGRRISLSTPLLLSIE